MITTFASGRASFGGHRVAGGRLRSMPRGSGVHQSCGHSSLRTFAAVATKSPPSPITMSCSCRDARRSPRIRGEGLGDASDSISFSPSSRGALSSSARTASRQSRPTFFAPFSARRRSTRARCRCGCPRRSLGSCRSSEPSRSIWTIFAAGRPRRVGERPVVDPKVERRSEDERGVRLERARTFASARGKRRVAYGERAARHPVQIERRADRVGGLAHGPARRRPADLRTNEEHGSLGGREDLIRLRERAGIARRARRLWERASQADRRRRGSS